MLSPNIIRAVRNHSLIDLAHIGSAVQQVRRKRMAEHMGAFLALYARTGQFRPYHAVNDASRYALSFVC